MCKPKREGGFNIKELLSWNKALMCKLMFKIHRNKGVWAMWEKDHYLRSTSLWEARKRPSDAWSWKNVLNVHDQILQRAGSVSQALDTLLSWCTDNKFIVTRAYDFFRTKGHLVNWHKVIWDTAALPKHSVIASLAIQNVLPTYAKFMERGFHGPSRCV